MDRGTLADGSQCLFGLYEGYIAWNGKMRSILVDETGVDPLIGMEPLAGYELKIQVRSHGPVTIKKLEAARGR